MGNERRRLRLGRVRRDVWPRHRHVYFDGGPGNDKVYAKTAIDGQTWGTLLGGDGNDTLGGGNTSNTDTLSGGLGDDYLLGGSWQTDGADVLSGGPGRDTLYGSYGNDVLIGGPGRDVMTGGSGRDRFVFDERHTSASPRTADYISDFAAKFGDRIDLTAVDANTLLPGDQSFAFIGMSAFSHAGQVRYEKTRSSTYVFLNTDGDAAAEAVIKLKLGMDAVKGWFVL